MSETRSYSYTAKEREYLRRLMVRKGVLDMRLATSVLLNKQEIDMERLPATLEVVLVRQGEWAPCSAWLTERNEWKFIEYQHPHHVTHWRHK